MNILFICNQNQNRSKKAQELFNDKFNTQSAGLYNSTPVNEKQLSWADVVVVMEEDHRSEVAKRFPKQYMQKRILSLDIPDIYDFHDSKLVSVLNNKMKEYSDILT